MKFENLEEGMSKDRYEYAFCDLGNLVDALQVVSWQLNQASLKQGTELFELRNAVVGISDAMDRIIKAVDAAEKTDRDAA